MAFYLYLPSNVNRKYYPNNRISSFTVKLPKRIVFQPGEYEVGLAEISYVKSLKFKLPPQSKVFGPTNMDPAIGKSKWNYLPNNVKYSSPEEVADAINKLLFQDNATIKWDPEISRFQIQLKYNSPVAFTKTLGEKLGFTIPSLVENGNILFKRARTYTASVPPTIRDDDVYQVYVYSDIVEPQIVGDSLVPLLRVVNLSGIKNEIVNQTFRPYYKPVAKFDFDTIEIQLSNEYGEELEFEKGECIITLHFRKKYSQT